MASIERRQADSGAISYRVKVRLRGHPPQSATFQRLTDARKWAQHTESAIRERRYFKTAAAQRHTLQELIDRYVEQELPKLPKVQRLVEPQLRWWAKRLGSYTLADINPPLIAEHRDRLFKEGTDRKKKISPATVNRYLAALSMAFSTAAREWQWVEGSPLKNVTKFPEPRGRVRYLSNNEWRKLRDACRASSNRFLYPVVVLAIATGARKMEILRLRWADVDLKRRLVIFHVTKNNERRSVRLSSEPLRAFRDLKKVQRIDSDLVFPGTNNPLNPVNIRDPWEKALRAAKIGDFRFHDLRHTAASWLAMNGASLPEIAAILGHKTLAMVQRYAHLSSDHTANVIESMNAKLFDAEIA